MSNPKINFETNFIIISLASVYFLALSRAIKSLLDIATFIMRNKY